MRLTYYDPARDYQPGEVLALAGEYSGVEARTDLAAVLSASEAKALTQRALARTAAGRDRQTVRLPPRFLSLQPGDSLVLSGKAWTVGSVTLDGFVVVAELRTAVDAPIAIAGDGGRIAPNDDVIAGEVTFGLFDVPLGLDEAPSSPRLFLAASRSTKGWKRVRAEIAFGASRISTRTSLMKSVLGHALTPLGPGSMDLIDCENGFDLQLVDAGQWLTSCDDAALAAGENLAILGGELFQFGRAEALGEGKFRLSRLLRGRAGTEWACAGHSEGGSVLPRGSASAPNGPDAGLERGGQCQRFRQHGFSCDRLSGRGAAPALACSACG